MSIVEDSLRVLDPRGELLQLADLASAFLDKLVLHDIVPSAPNTVDEDRPLHLPYEALKAETLVERGVPFAGACAFADAFKDAMSHLQASYQGVLSAYLVTAWSPSTVTELRATLEASFGQRNGRLRYRLVAAANTLIQSRLSLEERPAQAHVTPGSSVGIFTPEAHAILESAWQRGSKVTPAEKKRLAEACKLTIRQVTVWVHSLLCSLARAS